MLHFSIKTIITVFLLSQFVPSCAMFATLRNRFFVRRMGGGNVIGPVGQKRYQWQPPRMKEQLRIIAKTDHPDKSFPAHGAAIADSHFLKNVVSHTNSMENVASPLVVLANELFKIDDTGTIAVVMDEDKVSSLLTPEFFGVLRGAQQEGLLEKPEIIKQIVELAKAESVKIVGTERLFSEEKVKNFISVMHQVNKENSRIAQSLEDAYLFLRANPDNNHDLIHYLLGFNAYCSVLSVAQIKELQDLATRAVTQQPSLEYNNADYIAFKDALAALKIPSDQVKYAKDNFSLAVSAMLEEKRNMALYCPRVEMSKISYKGQLAFATCAESAFRDLFNNLFLMK